jgi:hypothetical protein
MPDADRMRDVLEEILKNCEGVLAGGLPHFSKRELAATVVDRARYALGKDFIHVRPSTAVPRDEVWMVSGPGVGVRAKLATESEGPEQTEKRGT